MAVEFLGCSCVIIEGREVIVLLIFMVSVISYLNNVSSINCNRNN
jgi:hypothetical protein